VGRGAVQSNLIVGATTLPLAVRLDRTSPVFRTFRLFGLVAITVTGIVCHVALSKILSVDRRLPWGAHSRPTV